jgi:pimeloyl-ACP methyl ester carboxylesterase
MERLYKLDYPKILTVAGQELANRVTDPKVLPSEPCNSPAGTIDPKTLIRGGELSTKWTDLLEMNSAPTAFLSIPVLVVQAQHDDQVFSSVTRSAMREACKDHAAVTYHELDQGGHMAPVDDSVQVTSELAWAQKVIRGEKVKNSCDLLLGKR